MDIEIIGSHLKEDLRRIWDFLDHDTSSTVKDGGNQTSLF